MSRYKSIVLCLIDYDSSVSVFSTFTVWISSSSLILLFHLSISFLCGDDDTLISKTRGLIDLISNSVFGCKCFSLSLSLLRCTQAYNKGTPIISNQEFDDLKLSLKLAVRLLPPLSQYKRFIYTHNADTFPQDSKIAVATEPKCYVDTGVCKVCRLSSYLRRSLTFSPPPIRQVTWGIDNFRSGSLYFPATLLATLAFLGVVSSRKLLITTTPDARSLISTHSIFFF